MIKQLKKQITKSKIDQTKGICTQITVKKEWIQGGTKNNQIKLCIKVKDPTSMKIQKV